MRATEIERALSEFDRESIDWEAVEEEALEFFEGKNFHVLIGVVDPVNDQEVLKSGVLKKSAGPIVVGRIRVGGWVVSDR